MRPVRPHLARVDRAVIDFEFPLWVEAFLAFCIAYSLGGIVLLVLLP